jgi:aminopeptidase-like protein
MTDAIDATIYSHVCALFPIFRSITGPGLRQTLRYIADQTGADIKEVASGTPVLDWIVPKEWTVRTAQIRRLSGEVVVDIAWNNLHLLQYSRGVDAAMSRASLDAHLHSLPDQPDLIPYRTAYYADDWGFCVSQHQRDALTDDAYHVAIDADLAPGTLSYAELLLDGSTDDEVLISVHCCHPSLANDNLSSIAVAIELAKWLAVQPRRLTYRFVFLPGTIGAIVWLAQHPWARDRVRHGLVLSCLGDLGPPTYKQSRRGVAPIDRYVAHVLTQRGHPDRIRPFVPYGYDERQYCSPGFDLPVGCLMRSANGTFVEYHTSADNLSFVKPAALADSLEILTNIVAVMEGDGYPLNLSPYGEPQLGRRGLYAAIGGQSEDTLPGRRFDQLTLLWVLNQADGKTSLLDIAERSGKSFAEIEAGAAALEQAGLLRMAWSPA